MCVCVVLFFKHSENICIPLNPACVALIISCMHQGFSRAEITRLKSHHTPPEEEGERCSLEPCLLQSALFKQRGEDKRINEERRGEVRYVAVVSLRTWQCIDTELNVSAWSHYDILYVLGFRCGLSRLPRKTQQEMEQRLSFKSACRYQSVFQSRHRSYTRVDFFFFFFPLAIYDGGDDNNTTLSQFLTDNRS